MNEELQSTNEELQPQRRAARAAPNDYHLLLERGYVRVTKGPKENRFRPAVDPLFRSAAHVYGPRVIGIVLSGALDDGTAGLWTIKQRGGTAIVQEPADARHRAMPLNALEHTDADHRLPAAEIGGLLGRLTREPATPAPAVAAAEQEKAARFASPRAGRRSGKTSRDSACEPVHLPGVPGRAHAAARRQSRALSLPHGSRIVFGDAAAGHEARVPATPARRRCAYSEPIARGRDSRGIASTASRWSSSWRTAS
jgi:hypothetical protein